MQVLQCIQTSTNMKIRLHFCVCSWAVCCADDVERIWGLWHEVGQRERKWGCDEQHASWCKI